MSSGNPSKKLADLDQAAAALSDFLPPLLWRMYTNLKAEGFDHQDALDLLKTYIMGMCRNQGNE